MEFKNKDVKEQLEKAGWKPGRNLKNQITFSYDDTPEFIKEFLYEYADLKVLRVPHPSLKVEAELYIFSDVEKEFLSGENDYPYYQNIIGRKLFPLGVYLPDAYNVCCDADGRVYKIGEYCYSVGKDLYEGIENIILMNTLKSLQLEEKTGKWWNMNGEYTNLP